MAVKALIPILNTSDLSALVAFLTDGVGFDFQWDVKAEGSDRPFYAGVGYGGIDAHLQLADSTPKEMQLYIYVDDVDAVYEELRAKGVAKEAPENRSYGMRDFSLVGPEGTMIGFGSDLPA